MTHPKQRQPAETPLDRAEQSDQTTREPARSRDSGAEIEADGATNSRSRDRTPDRRDVDPDSAESQVDRDDM